MLICTHTFNTCRTIITEKFCKITLWVVFVCKGGKYGQEGTKDFS